MTDLRVRLREDTLPIREVEVSERKRGRLVDRADNFGQSRGRFNIDRIVSTELRREFYAADWFHTIVNTKTHRVVCIVMAFYIGLFLLFALFYLAVVNFNAKCIPGARGYIRGNQSSQEPFPDDDDPDSHVGPVTFDTFIRVCFFSVQTMMTIGYGADDVYFGNCPSMLVLITMQSITGVFASSILFGLMLKRLVRASSRAQTIVFSENAIVRASVTDDELYLVIRVAEMRSHQLCQAYVHAYAMCDTTGVIGDTAAASEGAAVHALPMMLTHPTGEMLLVTPCFILHRLDVRSPLLPPELDPMHTRPPADWHDLPQLLRALQALPHEVVRPREKGGERQRLVGRHQAVASWAGGGGDGQRGNSRSSCSSRTTAGLAVRDTTCRDTACDMACRDTVCRDTVRDTEAGTGIREARGASGSLTALPPLQAQQPAPQPEPSTPLQTRATEEESRQAEQQSSQATARAATGAAAAKAAARDEAAAAKAAERVREAAIAEEELKERLAERMRLVKEHMIRTNAEVLVLIEGVDPTTSDTVQARQSYTVDDICWDATFVPCARRQTDGGIRIDFDQLHAVLPLGHLLPATSLMRMPTYDVPLDVRGSRASRQTDWQTDTFMERQTVGVLPRRIGIND